MPGDRDVGAVPRGLDMLAVQRYSRAFLAGPIGEAQRQVPALGRTALRQLNVGVPRPRMTGPQREFHGPTWDASRNCPAEGHVYLQPRGIARQQVGLDARHEAGQVRWTARTPVPAKAMVWRVLVCTIVTSPQMQCVGVEELCPVPGDRPRDRVPEHALHRFGVTGPAGGQ